MNDDCSNQLNQIVRRALVTAAFAAIAMASLTPPPAMAAKQPAASRRPNIVLIIADDHTYRDFGFMGSKQVRTPNLDELARNSARFTNAYVPTSVCRPSLASILTGLYPHQHDIFFNHPPPGLPVLKDMTVSEWVAHRAAAEHYIRDVPTIPRLLAANGYSCLQTGKLWEGDFRNVGFTEGMTLNKASADPAYGNRQVKDGVVAHGNGDAGLNIGRNTMQPIFDFVERRKNEPFFIWYAPMMPHLPYDAPESFRQPYENRSDVPENLVGYFGEITRFDETVGELLRYFDDQGLTDNTLFIFVADNGFRPTGALDTPASHTADDHTKLSPFDNGVRTPLLIHWSGHTRPATYEELVQSIDIMPTILAAAGTPTGNFHLPGINLLPVALGDEKPPVRPAFGEIYPNDAVKFGDPANEVSYVWVRDGNLKLIEHVRHDKGADVKGSDLTLYDLSRDPDELHDLARQPAQAAAVQRLRKLLREWWPRESPPIAVRSK